MIVDRGDARSRQLDRGGCSPISTDVPTEGEVKPELMESVCEIATDARAATRVEAGDQLRALRRTRATRSRTSAGWRSGRPARTRSRSGRTSGSSSRPRYRDLIAGLQFVARQEIIFGIHVHVGVDDPDKAIHVTNGMRVHVPLLLALSANSPFWRGDSTGLAVHAHADLPRLPAGGHPAALRRLRGLGAADRVHDGRRRSSRDYTYLWYDVRPHPNFGTVEIRVMDSQTRVEHTLALAALVQAMVKELRRALRRRARRSRATPTRCSTRTSGWPPATGSRASWWTCRTRTACRHRSSPGA